MKSPFKFIRAAICAAAAGLILSDARVLAEKRKRTISSPCPFTCQSFGLRSDKCREWKAGGTCFIEITQEVKDAPRAAPTAAPVIAKKTSTPASSKRLVLPSASRLTPEQAARVKTRERIERCERIHPFYQRKPRVVFFSMSDAGYTKQGQHRVRGMITGSCLRSAGYYEEGELVRELPIETSSGSASFRFDFLFREDARPEIRIYPVIGERQIVRLTSTRPG